MAATSLNSEMAAIVLGNFDGCHLGHKALFDALKSEAEKYEMKPVAISFEPHTRHIIQEPGHPELLTTDEEKKELIEACKIPLSLQTFDKELFSMPFRSFVENFAVEKFGAKLWVLSQDQRFGRGGKGSAQSLKMFFPEIRILEIKPVLFGKETISSSRIRDALKNGNIDLANAMLGRNYSLTGIVEHGAGKGKLLGFPTANLKFAPHKLLPKNGVYAGSASFDGKQYKAVVNVGQRPSMGIRPVGLEAHLLDFDGDLYDKKLTVELISRLRNEIKFDSVEDLKKQIREDISCCNLYK